jgi:histidine triad (HIT) family protein
MRPSASSSASERAPCPRREYSLPDDCLFCRLYREGDHVARTDGFVAINDINPKADVHLLVIPERHVDTFRDVAQFTPDEASRMLKFVAEAARDQALEDYNVIVNVGAGAGQTIFHLHWHVLGGRVRGMPA